MLRSVQTCCSLCTFFLLAAFPAWGEINAGTRTADRPMVSVSVYNDAQVPAAVLAQAERQAGKIFARAGLEVIWVNCLTREARTETQISCERFAWPAYLGLHVVTRSLRPMSLRPMNEVFGVAFLSKEGTGCYSDVFFDQARALQADSNVELADILGSVVAHELGHLLLGSNSHAVAGIMRARWQGEELRRLARGGLLFTSEQGERMRGKLKAALPLEGAAPVIAAQSTY